MGEGSRSLECQNVQPPQSPLPLSLLLGSRDSRNLTTDYIYWIKFMRGRRGVVAIADISSRIAATQQSRGNTKAKWGGCNGRKEKT